MFEIQLHNLSFKPERAQVVYVENQYNTEVNCVIQDNYETIKKAFKVKGYEFIYVPYLNSVTDKRVRYLAPYLSDTPSLGSDFLLDFMLVPENREKVVPCVSVFSHQEGDVSIFACWEICGDTLKSLLNATEDISDYVFSIILGEQRKEYELNERLEELRKEAEKPAKSSLRSRFLSWIGSFCEEDETGSTIDHDIRAKRLDGEINDLENQVLLCKKDNQDGEIRFCEDLTSDDFDDTASCCYAHDAEISQSVFVSEDRCCGADDEIDDLEELVRGLKRSVEKLQLKGITLAAIHKLIDKHEKISRMLITDDYRIFLPDYNNIEIEMGSLPKALFFTFLNHPEGIVIKNISDYYNEIFNIYKQLKPNFKEENLRVSVTKLTNPVGNGINENIARIRFAFVSKFDESLAQNYFISGKKGETYSIPLDRNMVEWEEE